MKNLSHFVATEYRNAVLSVIPIRVDGSKAPAIRSWMPFTERMANDRELDNWFKCPLGIGIVCGIISGGLEVLDFDDGSLFPGWFDSVYRIASRLTIIATAGGGYHVMFRCREIGGNIKIACDPAREKMTLIETRGEGGYIVACGSPVGTHSSGLTYDVSTYSGKYLPDVVEITPNERRELWTAARVFDKRPGHRQRLIKKYSEPMQPVQNTSAHPVILDFCSRHTWFDILTPHGWSSDDGIHWTRPGKSCGISAKVVVANDGSELLTVFTSNSCLDRSPPPGKSFPTYNKFDAWTQLLHGGNNKVAFAFAKREVAQ